MRTLVLASVALLAACEGVNVNVAADKPDDAADDNARQTVVEETTTTLALPEETPTPTPAPKKVVDAAGVEIGLLSHDGVSLAITALLDDGNGDVVTATGEAVAKLKSLDEGFEMTTREPERCIFPNTTCTDSCIMLAADKVDAHDATTLRVPVSAKPSRASGPDHGFRTMRDGYCAGVAASQGPSGYDGFKGFELKVTLPLRVED